MIRLVAALVFGLFALAALAQEPSSLPTEDLWIATDDGRHHFTVEVADTDQERALGLMFREEVPEGTGMLFDFGPPRDIAMWMKNTYVSLDMLFIDETGTIVRIAEETMPLSLEPIPSGAPVIAVLEVDAGTADELGIEVGDTVVHPLFGNQ